MIQKGNEITFTYEGSGFLQHMVRILTGTLLEVGQGVRDIDSILTLLESQTRSEAGPKVPPHGLCMDQVTY